MAQQLDDFKFPSIGGKEKYPWDEWLDGTPWRLSRPGDFTVTAASLRTCAVHAAGRRGMKIRTAIPDNETLIIQAYRP